jgi:protein SMG9
MEQSDFLVVGAIGRQGVGKSSVMSLLAGSRTGSGKPVMFRPESKEVWENESYQTTGLDMAVTPERVILLDTQPVLSEAMLAQFSDNPSLIPSTLSPDMYLEILSLQVALFMYTVCHVVVVVVDSMDHQDPIFKSATISSFPPSPPPLLPLLLLFLAPLSLLFLLPSYPLLLLNSPLSPVITNV